MTFEDKQELWAELQKKIHFCERELALSVTGINLQVMMQEHWNWLVEMNDLYSTD